MSASQIPNLNTLRRGGGARRSGRASLAGGVPDRNSTTQSWQSDKVIQRTDDDAALARWSATTIGYYQDDFAKVMSPSLSSQGRRMSPQYNRGTFVRTYSIDYLVERFIQAHATKAGQALDVQPSVQIISLGAGSDTRYFRIKQKQQRTLSATPGRSVSAEDRDLAQVHIRYHEIDFPDNTRSKIQHIQSPEVQEHLKNECDFDNSISPSVDGENYAHPSGYSIHALDLREIQAKVNEDAKYSKDKTIQPHGIEAIDPDLPTLIISECCLMYLSSADSERALQNLINLFAPSVSLAILIYETFRPNDAYGRMMVDNLHKGKHIHLQSIEKFGTLSSQRNRLAFLGFCDSNNVSGGNKAADMWFLWEKWVSKEYKDKINRLELFDEVEELVMLFRHYCVVWGWRDGKGDVKRLSEAWANLPADDAAD